MTKIEVGDIVEVTFEDHCLNSDDISICTAYGRIHINTEKQLTIDTWHPACGQDRELKDDTECFTIMQSSILEISILGYTESESVKPDEILGGEPIHSVSDMI